MLDKRKNALKVALLGMDARTHKTLAMYLEGPCKSAYVSVVNGNEADADIIDADLPAGRAMLAELPDKKPIRPLIILSLNDTAINGALHLQKPIKLEAMLSALAKARTMVENQAVKAKKQFAFERQQPNDCKAADLNRLDKDKVLEPDTPPKLKHYAVDLSERQKTSKHRTAMLMDEKGFTALMGGLKPFDPTDPESLRKASYNPKEYFQGYVQSAFKLAGTRGQVLQLNSSWKRLLIFPYSGEVWLDADDKQLRAFASIVINRSGNQKMSITPLDPQSVDQEAVDKFQTMEGMLWKLACWTSKGRFPGQFDIERPLYLKRWPNFTRLLVTPHALRIAALLIEKPRSAINIARELDIRPEYVFVFVSAASSIGLLGQAVRNADIEVAPPELKPTKKQGVLRRIIDKLKETIEA